MKKLTLNSARCKMCSDVLVSRHRHDWVACRGGHIFIDGGLDCRRAGTLKPAVPLNAIEDLSEYECLESGQGENSANH